MEKIGEILQIEFLGNTLQGYLISLIVFLGSLLVLHFIGVLLLRRLKAYTEKTVSKLDDFILDICEKTIFPLLYLGAFYFAAKQLVLNSSVDKLLDVLMVVVLTVQGLRLGLKCLVYLVAQTWLKKETQKGGTSVSKSILTIIKVTVWGLGVVFILDNLGFNISAIVAGLGITGIAVALACQTILGDLFNYFVIFFDKPFREGDFIVAGEYMGTIEDIGIKSTRIRALGGEEIIISNSNLTSSRLRNYKRMNHRRAEFSFRLSHGTPQEQLKKIPSEIRKIIEGINETRFDRAHFKAIDDAGFVIEVVYFVLDADYNKFMDIQEKINLAIYETLVKEDVEFASFNPRPYGQEAKKQDLIKGRAL